MKPHEEAMVRSLVQSMMHAAAALDQILNPEPEEPQPEQARPRRSYLGEEDTTTEEHDG